MTSRDELIIHVEAFLRETKNFTGAQVGAYAILMCTAFQDGSLPKGMGSLAKLCREDRSNFRKWIWPKIRHFFVTDRDGRLQEKRAAASREKIAEFSESQSARAKKRKKSRKAPVVDKAVDRAVETCGNAYPTSGVVNGHKIQSNQWPIHAAASANALESESSLSSMLLPLGATPAEKPSPTKEKKQEFKNGGEKRKDRPHGASPHQPINTAARQAWEHELATLLGADLYADAIPILQNDPVLCQRATAAERRQPGAGAMAAIAGLRQHARRMRP